MKTLMVRFERRDDDMFYWEAYWQETGEMVVESGKGRYTAKASRADYERVRPVFGQLEIMAVEREDELTKNWQDMMEVFNKHRADSEETAT